jgi:HTH-type transcriptional regulator, sugar sensing transcriptional regulator
MESGSSEYLVGLGLNKNEAKALDALISLGPSGASDVHRYSGMPRNKAYESLEKLAKRGMIEIQQGRPTLYRAVGAKMLINNLVEEYSRGAREALDVLERKQDDVKSEADTDIQTASSWMVRGEAGVKRRLAELIFNANQDVFVVGGYPPKYALAVKSALKAASKRGVNVRAISMIRPIEDAQIAPDDRTIIEFRTVRTSKLTQKVDVYDEKLIDSFRSMSGYGSMVIIDESTAFDIVDDGKNPTRVAGILIRAPGVPRIQKATVERIMGMYTRNFERKS